MVNDGFSKIIDLAKDQDFYNGVYGGDRSNSSWSWTSILYYGSIALITLGTLYLGFKIYNEFTSPPLPVYKGVNKGKLPDFGNYPRIIITVVL